MEKTLQVDLWLAVLGSINRLSKRKQFIGPTLSDIKKDLRERYNLEISDRYLLNIIAELERKGLVKREKGLLRDRRETIFTTTQSEDVVLSLIRLDDKKAFVHNGWEGTVYDPPSSRSYSLTYEFGSSSSLVCPRCHGPLKTVAPHVYYCTLEKVMLRICPACGKPITGGVLEDNHFVCSSCGAVFSPCPKCKGWARRNEDSLRCVDCGFQTIILTI